MDLKTDPSFAMSLDIGEQDDVSVFWDFSSTQDFKAGATVSTSELVKSVTNAIRPYGTLKSIRLYWDHSGHPSATRLRCELSASGVYLIDCPAEGRSNGAMKKMLVDLIFHAWDHEAVRHTYVIITTDRDVAYAFSRLRMKEYRVVLLSPSSTHSDLTSQATFHLDWVETVLGGDSYTDPGGVPPTTGVPISTTANNQPRSREGTFGSVYHDSPLPNTHEERPRVQQGSSSPFQVNIDHNDRSGTPNHLPPRASTWPTAGTVSPRLLNLNPKSMPKALTALATSSGVPGVPLKPLLPYVAFNPFNEDEEWPVSSARGNDEKKSGKGKERAAPSSSGSDTSYSFVRTQEGSVSPTSVGEEPAEGETQGLPPSENAVSEEGGARAKSASPNPTIRPPVVQSTIPSTTTVNGPAQPPSKVPVATPSVARNPVTASSIWTPLIRTLRENQGIIGYTDLPTKLLKSYPTAYKLAGHPRYTPYIESALQSGIVESTRAGGQRCIRLKAGK